MFFKNILHRTQYYKSDGPLIGFEYAFLIILDYKTHSP